MEAYRAKQKADAKAKEKAAKAEFMAAYKAKKAAANG